MSGSNAPNRGKDRVGHVARRGHVASMHDGHVVNMSSTWRALRWGRWAPVLGLLWAKFGHGLKRKVPAHKKLYNFY
jgi:hypothetical protein